MSDEGRQPRTSLSGYFQGISNRLQSQMNTMTPIIVHSGEMGDNDHQWFAEFLRQYLPERVGMDTGFVVNHQSDRGSEEFFSTNAGPRNQDESIGPQSDILLLDVVNNAPFCVEKTFRVCPVEMVLGVIEVTRALNATKLESDLGKIARVRKLGADKKYGWYQTFTGDDDEAAVSNRRPLGYIVGLTGDVALETIIQKVAKIDDDLRPNMIAILDRALYIRVPFQTTFAQITEDVLFHFVSFLRTHLDRFPRGAADLGAYLPAVAEMCWLDDGTMCSSSAEAADYDDLNGTSGP